MDQHPQGDLFQLGYVDVAASDVEAPGVPLPELARELGFEVDAESSPGRTRSGLPVEDPPAEGWRVLHVRNRSTVLGAPMDDDRRVWRVAHLEKESANAAEGSAGARPRFSIHPDPLPLRPGRQERRRGLELRWPAVMTEPGAASAAGGEFAVDIVNTGDTRWRPDGDGFLVVGTFTAPGVADAAFGWAALGQDRAVPLDPGEYARVPVSIDGAAWKRLEPGPYDLRALLVDLGLPSVTPLRVDLDAETIARRRTPPRRR